MIFNYFKLNFTHLYYSLQSKTAPSYRQLIDLSWVAPVITRVVFSARMALRTVAEIISGVK